MSLKIIKEALEGGKSACDELMHESHDYGVLKSQKNIKQALTSLEKLEAVDVGELREVLEDFEETNRDATRSQLILYEAAALLVEFLGEDGNDI